MSDILLEMCDITKHFPGVIANDGVCFDLKRGEIHALVGENGAGKSTLMKILYGLYRQDSGKILINNGNIIIKDPKDAINLGIGMVHQHFMLVPPFTVLENIILGRETGKFGILDNAKPVESIKKIMEKNRLSVDLGVPVEELPVGLQQRVEILKILYRGAEILIFDEPTAVLTPQEVVDFFKTLRSLADNGMGIVFISHKLDEVLEIADRITVLRRGKIIKTVDKNEATKSIIAELMVGKPVLLEVDKPRMEPGNPILDVKNVTVLNSKGIKTLDGLSFSVREGEIYGIAGVEGNGQTELLNTVAGDLKPDAGEIKFYGEDIVGLDIRKKRGKGMSHIPEDRQKSGLLLPFSLSDNIVLGRHHKLPFVNRFQVIRKNVIRDFARKMMSVFDIRSSSETKPVNTLSGGNQQKVIIARELSSSPKLLVAAQPTRGVDVGAIEFIHKQIVKARCDGVGILLVSADLDEVLSLSDRIGVIFKGKIIREFSGDEISKEKIGFYMTGEKDETN
jgi:general nucleoside transport system ATP-binding protein